MKKILVSLVIISIILMIVVSATVAYFSDSETNRGNTFANGTLDLQISDQDDPWGDGVTATWVMDDMIPGDISARNSVYLRNIGSIEADHVEISVENITTDPNNEESDIEHPTIDNLDKWMEIIEMYYSGNNVLIGLNDNNANGWKDLDDLESQGLNDLTPSPSANSGNMKTFTMQLKFREDIGNEFQGDVLESTFTFRLNQDASQ
ncbi:M73 family metallopeptidase [Patescibacteria group bacterium]|nr:M73 family metallopeptidase [Patescibacteria group bacterium]MBU4512203.1 M73 family metallopeptidase [Patescibacteria group bacterium]MCG2693448.1 CalY family protein [Candidatus Parcubacteria bacterium]